MKRKKQKRITRRKSNRLRLSVYQRTGRYADPNGANWTYSIEKRMSDDNIFCEINSGAGFASEDRAKEAGNEALRYFRNNL